MFYRRVSVKASKAGDVWRFPTVKICHEVLPHLRSSKTRMEIYMAQPFLNDASSLVSLRIEKSNGIFEVILRRIEFDRKAGFAPVQLIPLSGAFPFMPAHLSGECNVDAETVRVKATMPVRWEMFCPGLTRWA